MIAPSRMSASRSRGIRSSGNSSPMTAKVAAAAPAIPSARCPAWRPITVTKNHFPVVAASPMRCWTRSFPRLTAVVYPNVGTSGGSGRSLSIVFGTWTTARSPAMARATREAAKAVSSPPMVRRYDTPRRLSVSATMRRASGVRAGLDRDVRRIEPPSKWMRETSAISSSRTCWTSPSISHLKPSRQPRTRSPWFRASMVAAAITALMPGDGPPPTRMARVFMDARARARVCNARIGRRRCIWRGGRRPSGPRRYCAPRPPTPSSPAPARHGRRRS